MNRKRLKFFLPAFFVVFSFSVVGCSSGNENSYQKHLQSVTLQNAAYLKAHGFTVNRVDTQSGFIQAHQSGSADNLSFHYPHQPVTPYVAENWTLFNSMPSASVTSYLAGAR
jgi:hypothetical protein